MADETPAVVEEQAAPPPVVDVPTPAPKAAKCPICKAPMEVYTGDNSLKFGTGFCPVDGRQPLKG